MTDKLVSIAMATYNGELYLVSQLNSILHQTYKNIEIVIVDDCSSDSTVSIIRQYQKQYQNIHLVKNEINFGVVKSFEKAMRLCRGDYIALSDQDDVWYSYKLEKLITNIGNSLLIHSDAILVDSKMRVIAQSNVEEAKKDKFKSEFIDYLISNNVTGCTTLFPRILLEYALPIPDGFYVHDHYLAIIASFYGTVKFLDEQLIYYRQHGNNTIGAKRPNFDKFIAHCNIIASSYNLLLTMPAFKDNFLIKLIRDYRLSFYMRRWTSKFSILRLLQVKHGVKLLLYYLLLSDTFGNNISKKIYNYLYKTES